jgi:hypothetical protein
MVVTIHVAAVACVIRSLATPSTLVGSLLWVPATISVAVFLSWPVGRAIVRAFDPGDVGFDRICPTCGRPEIRPLIRPGTGLFHPITGYRCAACRSTLRREGEAWVVALEPRDGQPIDPSGISYLSDPLGEDAIRFLDDPPGSPGRV